MKKNFFIACCIGTLITAGAAAQPSLVLPQVSQRAEVKQTIGLTDIDIVYHSPLVNKRRIWGELVPYGQVWRAGANENTTISFTDDVTINGNPLPAGTYGLHMIPGKDEWTIIFSKNHTSWGSFFYDEKEDALRVNVKPATREFQEWLDYTFTDRTPTSAKVAMSWEKVKVSFAVGVDVTAVTLSHIRQQMRNLPGYDWRGLYAAAHYCIANKVNYDEALQWIDRSIMIDENYTNLSSKARLLALKGNAAEADEARQKAMALVEQGAENSVNLFGYQLMMDNDVPTAIEVFKINIKKHPDSWNVYDSMGEAYHNSGDNGQSLSFYKIALSKAPDNQKDRIKKIIGTMQKG